MREEDQRHFAATGYFWHTRQRADRRAILLAWIVAAIEDPTFELVQADGRIRRWRYVPERDRYLRVVLLADGRTVHNAFFDRDFAP